MILIFKSLCLIFLLRLSILFCYIFSKTIFLFLILYRAYLCQNITVCFSTLSGSASEMHCSLLIHLVSAFETARTLLKIFSTTVEQLFLKIINVAMRFICLFYFSLTYERNEPVTVDKQKIEFSCLVSLTKFFER